MSRGEKRAFTNATFNNMLPQLAELGPTQFRHEVLAQVVMAFDDMTVQAASTHYNHALKMARAAVPELVVGLGRAPEKNNGGRKKKVAVEANPAVLALESGALPGEAALA
jgi:hypothetical protein